MPTKRATTKEERRDECRRKGIFVIADDTEMEPTIFEKPATGSRPAFIKDKNKSLRWKKTDVKREKKKGSESGSKEEVPVFSSFIYSPSFYPKNQYDA